MTDAKPAEPSIEDILASIRKIISDDDGDAAHTMETDAAPPPSPAPHSDDVLELTDVVLDPEEEPVYDGPAPREVTMQPIEAPPPRPEPEMHEMHNPGREISMEPIDHESHRAEGEAILSPRTAEAATGAFARLNHHAAPEPGYASAQHVSSGLTVEDIARELMRPMLRSWVDNNLQPLVERLVEKELRRISRKAEDL